MDVVKETLAELDCEDKPVLTVFNKIDALEDRNLLRALRREHPNAAFVSALRGIGLEQLKTDLLNLVERDFVDRVVYVPVTEPKAIARIHEIADVESEEYMYAEQDDADPATGDEPQAVARIAYRAAPRNDDRIQNMLASFGPLRPLVMNGDLTEEEVGGDGKPADAEPVTSKSS
jgi:GTP-binding protein HflX